MKNVFKARNVPLFGIITLVMVIGLSMAACDDGGGDHSATVVDYGWYNNGSEFTISTAAQLAGLANIVNGTTGGAHAQNNFNGKTITLAADIDLSNKEWAPIGNNDNGFSGTFNGNGKTITGLSINNSDDRQSLFGVVGADGVVKNLAISGNVTGGQFVGGIVGSNRGTVQNCSFSGSVTGSSAVGGIAGSNGGIVQNCYTTGSVSGGGIVGGIVGENANASVRNCAALNTSITRKSGSGMTLFGRVMDREWTNTVLSSNYGLSQMEFIGVTIYASSNANGVHGADVTKENAETESWWTASGRWSTSGGASAWDFNTIWRWDSAAKLPKFRSVVGTTITYTVTPSGSPATTALTFTFSADPGNLTASEINLTGNASKGSGAAVTGTGTTRTLSPITVSAAGAAVVSISKTGIETASKNITVSGDGTITYTVSPSGSPATTALTFTFSVDPGNLTASEINLTGNASKGSGAAVTGTGTTRTLSPITVSAAGAAVVSISKTGIETASKNITVNNGILIVSSTSDAAGSATTPGTLRYALTNVLDGGIIRFSGPHTIALTSALPPISTKGITIEGNGATITRSASWTTVSDSSLLYFNSTKATVNISRVWFKDGKSNTFGGAITSGTDNESTLTLESCIFSGNQSSSSNDTAGGGAVCNFGTLNLRGCTFYNNKRSGFSGRGGAVYSSGPITLAGNLFYENTASGWSVVYHYSGNVTSNGYNVVDVNLGTGTSQSGWTAAVGDKTISDLPVSPVTFKPLSGGGAAGVLTSLPSDYPSVDFYGDPITAGGAAGAVQSLGNGYYLVLTVNNAALGSVSTSPAPDADGLYPTAVTLTANPATGYVFSYWLVNGVKENANPLAITLTGYTSAQAVFGRLVTVSNASDAAGSATTPGTLRYALTNAWGGVDIIRFSEAYTVELESALPEIRTSVTIEGNGSTITRAAGWTATSDTSQLLRFNDSSASAVVHISRIHFKDGRATNYSGAIYNYGSTLIVESCIFSGNQSSGNTMLGGGAVSNANSASTLHLRGCTFYNNKRNGTQGGGGAVYNYGTLTLTGNLFYGNTAAVNYPVVYRASGNVISNGYNVVDVNLGTGTSQSGWNAGIMDTTVASLLGSNATLPFVDTTLKPVASLNNIMPSTPIADFPATDFNGETREWPGAPGAMK